MTVERRDSGSEALGELLVLSDAAANSAVTLSPRRGAIVTSFRVGDRELLYMDEGTLRDAQKNVRGGVPVLFPSPGKLAGDAFTTAGRSGKLAQHGFARTNGWTLGTIGADAVTLTLEDTEATRAAFPFPFHVEMRISLRGASLRHDVTVRNTGNTELPHALGFHPYFAVSDKASARIDTAATRAFDNVKKETGPFHGFDLTAGEVDVHLLDHGSTESALRVGDGAVRVKASSDFALWVVWTLPGKDFVCLEPWTAPGNALNTGERLTRLAPNESRTSWMEISWVPVAASG